MILPRFFFVHFLMNQKITPRVVSGNIQIFIGYFLNNFKFIPDFRIKIVDLSRGLKSQKIALPKF